MMISFKKIVLIFALFILISTPLLAQNIGYVVEVKGDWYVSGRNTPLKVFDQLPASGVIRVQSPKHLDRIVVVANGQRISRRCPIDCTTPISLPRVPRKAVTDIVKETIISLSPWAKAGVLLGIISSRGGALSEDIISLKERGTEITALNNLEGENCLRWRKVPTIEKESFGEWLDPLKLKKDKKVFLPDIKPGLYEFALANPRQDCLVNYPQTAWILVSSAKDFDKNKKSFQTFKKTIDEWNADEEEFPLREETVTSLLRAHLLVLAKENSKR